MNSEDPQMEPDSAPILGSGVFQPFARRTVAFFMWAILIIGFIGFTLGWFSTNDDEYAYEDRVTLAQINNDPAHYEETRPRNGIYGFFYSIFSGIDDGLRDSPHNLNNVEHIDNMSIDTHHNTPIYLPEDNQREEYFDGKILDYQGNVAGDISAVKYKNGDIESFNFILKKALTPADKERRYSIPKDMVKIIQVDGLFMIQLNEAQTKALAERLYTKE